MARPTFTLALALAAASCSPALAGGLEPDDMVTDDLGYQAVVMGEDFYPMSYKGHRAPRTAIFEPCEDVLDRDTFYREITGYQDEALWQDYRLRLAVEGCIDPVRPKPRPYRAPEVEYLEYSRVAFDYITQETTYAPLTRNVDGTGPRFFGGGHHGSFGPGHDHVGICLPYCQVCDEQPPALTDEPHDVAPVPVPAAAWLLLLAIGSLFGVRRLV